VVLRQVHVEISGSSGLLAVVAQRQRAPGCGRMHKDLLCGVMDRMADHQRTPLRLARTIERVGIDLPGRLVDHPAHQIDMRRRVTEFDHVGL
jgi:hypothetical protein